MSRGLPLLLPALALLAGAARADERDLEPVPPAIFFTDPHPATTAEVDYLVTNSFGDLNKAPQATETLVVRYGVVSAPRLALEIRRAANEPQTHHALLTVAALRDRYGAARELWVALEPMLAELRGAAEPYRRAFAALALGAFHGPASVPPPPGGHDPLVVQVAEAQARRTLEDAVRALGDLLDDPSAHFAVRVAASLALAKTGGPAARGALDPLRRVGPGGSDAFASHLESRMAVFAALGLLPVPGDEALLLHGLGMTDRRDRRAAALAVALQALAEPAPAWTREGAAETVLAALKAPIVKAQLEDGAEAAFARGVLALRASGVVAPEREWEDLFDVAVRASTEERTAVAAAQSLLFCPEPWFPAQAAEASRQGSLPAAVLSAFLLHLGSLGTRDGYEATKTWLTNPTRPPKGKPEGDVRTYAALGLLRALAAGRFTDPVLRAEVIDLLDRSARRTFVKGPVQDELIELLDAERRFLEDDPFYRLPERRLLDLEAVIDDPDALTAKDQRDVAVARLHALVLDVFGVREIKPGAPGQPNRSEMPQRRLKAFLERHGYFSRRDLLEGRGLRPLPQLDRGTDPERRLDR
jgi:hypothetical protein